MAISTGFHDGQLTRRKTLKHFRGCWFLIDSGIVVCDWISIVLTLSEDARLLKLIRFAKLSRAFRLVGILRMAKLMRMYEESSRFASGAILAVIRFLGMVCLFLWVNHCLSCVFYRFGKLEHTDTEPTWLGTTLEIGGELVMYQDLNMWYLYWTSFHWCISQTTLGAIELVASNTAERLLSVVLMLFGLLINSTLVSSCSAILVGIQMRAAGEAKQAWDLERFLHQNQISGELAGHVHRIVMSRLAKPKTLLEVDVPSLKALPSTMLAELRAGIYRPHLETHSFFNLMLSAIPSICEELCGHLNFQLLQAGDELFQPGTACEHVHLIVSGDMKYEQHPVSSPVPRCVSKDIKEGKWLCEGGLWTQWIHVGRLEARSEVKLLNVVPGHVISFVEFQTTYTNSTSNGVQTRINRAVYHQ